MGGIKSMHVPISSSLVKRRRLSGLTAVTVAVGLLLLSPLVTFAKVAPSAEAVQEEPVVYKLGTMSEPDTFNPFNMVSGTSWSVAHMMYEFLYAVGPLMEPYPQLAVSHEVSPDYMTWTYHLAEDSYWHLDGEKVTADDVVFTFKMVMDYPVECALLNIYVDGFEDVVALDDYTVQITLSKPKANMLSLIVPILPEHYWTAVRDDGKIDSVDMWESDYFPYGPVGSGPFILDEYSKTGGYVRLKAQDPYHRLPGIEVDSVNVDELLFVIYTNQAAMTDALITGEIDVIDGIPPLVYQTIIDDPDIEGQEPAALILEEFGFNCATPEVRESVNDKGSPNFPKASDNYETCNLSVRKALTMATDIPYITREIHQGLAVEAYAIIPTATPFWHYEVPDEEKYHFSFDNANATLEPWYSDIDGDDIRENKTSGVELSFDFYYIRQILADEQTAEKMKQWWEVIGVEVNLFPVAEGTLYNLWFNMEYDMFIWSWWPDVDPTWFLSVLTTGEIPTDSNDITKWSDSFYSNPEYDQLWIEQQETMDIYERQAIVHEMQRIAYRDCPYICLVYPASLIGYRTDRFTNFPDMVVYSGITPSSFWYYFEIRLIGSNTPPYDVYPGDDRTVYLGEEETFSGSAEDLDNSPDELNWTWTILSPEGGTVVTLYGQTVKYTFTTIGEFEVSLKVKDPEGLSDSASLTVTVIEMPADVGWIVGYVKDDAGEPIEGAQITITEIAKSDTTNEQGFYNLTVEPGVYEVNASAKGHSEDSASVSVETQVVSWQNFTLEVTAGSVAGQVLESATEDPIAGASVKLYRPGEESASYSKLTDADGNFAMLLVDEGTYEVEVMKIGYMTNDTEIVTVIAGETSELVIYLAVGEDEDGGLSTTAIAAAAVIAAVIVMAAAAAVLLRRKKHSEPGPPPET